MFPSVFNRPSTAGFLARDCAWDPRRLAQWNSLRGPLIMHLRSWFLTLCILCLRSWKYNNLSFAIKPTSSSCLQTIIAGCAFISKMTTLDTNNFMNFRVAPTTRSFGCSCNQIACQGFSSIIVAAEYYLHWKGKKTVLLVFIYFNPSQRLSQDTLWTGLCCYFKPISTGR